MKFRDGYMLRAGQPATDFVDSAVRHVLLRQGVLGVKVSILLPSYDPLIKGSINKQLPDVVIVREPKPEENVPLVPTGTPAKGSDQGSAAGGAAGGAAPGGQSFHQAADGAGNRGREEFGHGGAGAYHDEFPGGFGQGGHY